MNAPFSAGGVSMYAGSFSGHNFRKTAVLVFATPLLLTLAFVFGLRIGYANCASRQRPLDVDAQLHQLSKRLDQSAKGSGSPSESILEKYPAGSAEEEDSTKNAMLHANDQQKVARKGVRTHSGKRSASAGDSDHSSTRPEAEATAVHKNEAASLLAHRQESDEEVDVIFTWVDGDDPAWQKKRNLHADSAPKGGNSFREKLLNEDNTLGSKRYKNHDELKFALRSIELYAPWVRRIYIVTDDQTPSWLDVDHPKVRLTSHTELWTDPHVLPVFNSFAIETQLFNIPDLAQYVFIMNDDMMFGKPQTKQSWIDSVRGHAVFPEASNSVDAVRYINSEAPLPLSKEISEWDALDYSAALLNKRFGRRSRGYVSHMPIIVETSVARECIAEFNREFYEASGRKFRGFKDIHVKFLFTHYRLERYQEELFLEGVRTRLDSNADALVTADEIRALAISLDSACRKALRDSSASLSYRDVLLQCDSVVDFLASAVDKSRDATPGDPWYPYRHNSKIVKENFFLSASDNSPSFAFRLKELWKQVVPDTVCINDDTGTGGLPIGVTGKDPYELVARVLNDHFGTASSFEKAE
eukprot:ANDGO_03851.mRNA.1 Exopolysaccharide phosphotransferase SCO2594